MNFQLKALVAALALAAASVPAYADIELPNTGNGSTILVVLDRAANLTATFDLGLHYSDFNQFASAGAIGAAASTNLSWDFANDANYSTTWNALFANGATLANMQYAFLAADNLGVGVGGMGFVSSFQRTGANTVTGSVTLATGQLRTAMENIDVASTITTNLNTSTANGAALQGTIATPYNVSGKLSNIGNFVFDNIGNTMGMSQYITGSNSIAPTQSVFGANFIPSAPGGLGARITLATDGKLSYVATSVAAVPEADTYAMMVLGLGLVGFAARRKQA